MKSAGAYLPEPGERLLSTEPIRRILADLRDGDQMEKLAELYADRFETSPRTGYRHVARLRDEDRAPASLIDRLLVLLDRHPIELYRDAWTTPA